MNLNFSKHIDKMADESLGEQMFLLVQLKFLQQQSQPAARLPINPWIELFPAHLNVLPLPEHI